MKNSLGGLRLVIPIFVIYTLCLGVHIGAEHVGNEPLRMISKSLLMPLLLGFYLINLPKPIQKKQFMIAGALVFSWLGDIFLLKNSPVHFMLGLGAFLTAHLAYIITFLQQRNRSNSLKMNIVKLFPFLIFIGLFLSYLNPYLNATPELQEMLVPVTVYAFVIGMMGYSSTLRHGAVGIHSYRFTLMGSLLFIISDSCIALNKFVMNGEMSFAAAIIMITYCLAQWLIVTGILKSYSPAN